jgi:hypothetical protein
LIGEGPANDLVGGGLRALRLEQLPLFRKVGEGHHALRDGVVSLPAMVRVTTNIPNSASVS